MRKPYFSDLRDEEWAIVFPGWPSGDLYCELPGLRLGQQGRQVIVSEPRRVEDTSDEMFAICLGVRMHDAGLQRPGEHATPVAYGYGHHDAGGVDGGAIGPDAPARLGRRRPDQTRRSCSFLTWKARKTSVMPRASAVAPTHTTSRAMDRPL